MNPPTAMQEGFEHKPPHVPPVGLLATAAFGGGYLAKWARLTYRHPNEA